MVSPLSSTKTATEKVEVKENNETKSQKLAKLLLKLKEVENHQNPKSYKLGPDECDSHLKNWMVMDTVQKISKIDVLEAYKVAHHIINDHSVEVFPNRLSGPYEDYEGRINCGCYGMADGLLSSIAKDLLKKGHIEKAYHITKMKTYKGPFVQKVRKLYRTDQRNKMLRAINGSAENGQYTGAAKGGLKTVPEAYKTNS